MSDDQGKQFHRHQFSHQTRELIRVGVVLGGWLLIVGTTQAAGISPSAPPPAGQVAVPLNTSGTAQKKTGSLVIGSTLSPSKLCLNAESATDEVHCISSWSASSTYVRLQSGNVTEINSSTPTDPGYVRIQGASSSVPTVSLNMGVGSGATGKTALYAYGNAVDDDAGLFQGRVAIENNAAGLGRFCLNGTDAKSVNSAAVAAGWYCITAWTDLPVPTISQPLTLQPSGTGNGLDSGNIQISGTYASGTITVGDPSELTKAFTCGDGICSSNENNTVSDPNYCQIDCEPVVIPTSFSTTAGDGQVSLTVTHSTNTSVLIVRSSQVNSTFAPADGSSYSVGGTSTFAVVFSGCQSVSPCTYIDSSYGLVNGTTYYYRAYAVNAWPRYSLPAVKSVQPGAGGGASGDTGGGEILPGTQIPKKG